MSVQEKLSAIPEKPGVYLFKDAEKRILYIGKALSLKNRVKSYFQKEAAPNPRLQLLVRKICDLDYILCDSDLEAYLLEYNLIKEHHPPYNVQFRDDKRFPLIKVVLTDPFPYITVARKREPDGNRYFGPYISSWSMRQTLKIIRKIFQIRSCTMKITGHDRSCLYYHIKECSAPCISAISREKYMTLIHGIIQFLEGKEDSLIKELENQMETASRDLDFELAAQLRDQIQSLRHVQERQKIISDRVDDEDYVGVVGSNGLSVGIVFSVRQGKLLGKDEVIFENVETDETSVLSEFVEKYYQDRGAIPARIATTLPLPNTDAFERFLSAKAGFPVHLENPKRSERKQMLDLVQKNASHALELARLKELRMRGMLETLEKLQQLFRLPSLPFRIEGYDISNLFGKEAVASMVVFIGGKPEKSHYRKFSIQCKETPDDFAMMEEVLKRRLQRLLEPDSDASFFETPDLILLDGGRGQLSVGIKVLKQFNKNIPILSLAKKEEEIYHPEMRKPVQLSGEHAGLRLLQHVRDEAHRFAVSYHKNRRDKKITASVLDEIPGIGEKRKHKLLQIFGSVDQVKVATAQEIVKALRCSKTDAEKILAQLTGP